MLKIGKEERGGRTMMNRSSDGDLYLRLALRGLAGSHFIDRR